MSAKCGLCGVAEKAARGEAPWAIRFERRGIQGICLKPFGAVHPQHRIFVPVEHVVYAGERPDITGAMFEAAAEWGGPDRPFNLIVQSGKAAGQGTWHLHIHYVPREVGDGLGYRWKKDT